MNQLSIAGLVRRDILDAALSTGKVGAHLAPSLSLAEIVISILSNFERGKDSFVLSKGHGALGYYAVMHQLGWISDEQFSSFESNGGEFPGQPSRTENNHVEYSGGSLGMGISYAAGVAMAKKQTGGNVYVVLGDGELNEGNVWEAAALANHLKLDNLIAVVDHNGLQSDGQCQNIMEQNLEALWKANGWQVLICDGHSLEALSDALKQSGNGRPTVILAQTVKGNGISFMENDNTWHHNTLNEAQYHEALAEIGERYGFSEK